LREYFLYANCGRFGRQNILSPKGHPFSTIRETCGKTCRGVSGGLKQTLLVVQKQSFIQINGLLDYPPFSS